MNSKLILILSCFLAASSVFAQRSVSNFNHNWKFILDDKAAFAEVAYDDASWSVLEIPHDWAFENGIHKNGAQKQGGGYHDGGIGWYRKTFHVEQESLTNTTYIEFDGVYMNSEVWVNGTLLGKRPYGYISFRYDISHLLHKGENIMAVRVDNSLEPSARWYHPCGIYAPVSLIETKPIHIAPNGIFVTVPEITPDKAKVNVEITLRAKTPLVKNTRLETGILSVRGEVLQTASIHAGEAKLPLNLTMEVDAPRLWSPETPELYTLVTRVLLGEKLLDEVKTNFGFRTVEWKTETGFWLNGENIKLKGVCEHWEGGPVGGAWTKPLLRWKLQLLKEMGINAIRPSHNPCPPMFYDLCDEIGLLVMDEIFDGWHKKATNDYGAQAFDQWWQRDVTEWIMRDRNHPSVFVWSLGNETHSDVAPDLVAFCKKLDPTRLTTSGSGNTGDMPIAGVNGGSETQSFIENRRFDKPFVSTEAPHTWQTRGYYRTQTWWRDSELKGTYPLPDLTEKEIFFYEWADPKTWKNKKQHLNSSYDNATVRISARKNWELMRDLPWHSGHFRWTGFDYYGESGLAHGAWPFNLFMGGAIDVAGFPKDLYYFYQSQWNNEPMLHLLPHWTHPHMEKGTLIPVWAYSNADEVELFLNGKSLGKDRPGTVWDEMQCEWMVPYEEGKLEAVAYTNGKEVKRTHFATASQAVELKNTMQTLNAEASFESNYILTSEAIDRQGNLCPYAQNKVYYALQGDIEQISLESGSPIDSTSRAKASCRAMFMGKTRAVLQNKKNARNAGVLIASILGDQSLHFSKSIHIYTEEINIMGGEKGSPLEIRYTTNGDDPTQKGILYKKPFDIKDGVTVKAVVKQNDKVILSMSEDFGSGKGLFWGNENSEKMWAGRGLRLQAENALLKGSATLTDKVRWNRGEGAVTFENKEGSITWYRENDGDADRYTLRFRYTHNDSLSVRPMTLTVNDEPIKTFEFKPTGSWQETWRSVSAKVTLRPGANNIELKTTGQSGPHIDELSVE